MDNNKRIWTGPLNFKYTFSKFILYIRIFAFLALVCSSRRSTVYNRSKQQRDNNMIGGWMSIYDPKTPKTLLMHSTIQHYKDALRRASSTLCPPSAQRPTTAGTSAGHPTPWRWHGSSYRSPSLPSWTIEHRVQEKKSKFRPFLGAAGVEDAKRFVAARVQRPFWSTCRPCVVSLSYVFAPWQVSFLQSIMHKWHFVECDTLGAQFRVSGAFAV